MADGVWQSAAFIGLFGDPFLRNTPYEAGGSPQALAATLDAFAQVLHPQSAFVTSPSSSSSSAAAAAMGDPVVFVLSATQEQFVLERLVPQLQRCKQWTEAALKVGDAKQLQAFLAEWKAQLLQLQPGEPLLVPGGFVSNIASHTILYVVEKLPDGHYTFTVCNKGPGADMYHPQTVQTGPLATVGDADKIRVQSCVQIGAIPPARFLDMAFWTLLFSLWVRTPPSEFHRAETLYDVLLPWLAGDQLLPIAFEEAATAAAWATTGLGTGHTPQRSNVGFCKSTVEAVRYLCLRSGAFTAAEVKYAVLFKLRYRLFQRTVRDLEVANNPSRAFADGVLDRALHTLSAIALTDSLQGSHRIASAIAPDAVVGIYFARSTCAPCRKFTKALTALTASLRASNRELVVIVLSVDQEQTDYTALVADLPAVGWLVVPFTEVEARKQLVQLFQVNAVPTLVLRGVDGAILTARGRELVQADPTGRFFPWNNSNGFTLPKAALSLSAAKCIAMATHQIGVKTLAHNWNGDVNARGLSHVNALMAQVEALVNAIRDANAGDATSADATFKTKLPFVGHANAGLLKLGRREDEYAGSAAEIHAPTLGNFLDVPERVTSIPLAVAAFVRCRALCESLLTRAAEGSSSSRISLHHEVIQLLTTLLVEVLPVPEPSPAAGATGASTCMWRQPVAREMQLRCLNFLYSALMTLGCVWQSMEQPSRHFDSERSLAALCALSMFDALLRTPAADEPLEISLMMEQDGGYVLGHRFCKANFSLAKMTSLMEFARPSFCVARGRVLAYFDRQDEVSKLQLFQYHMPEDKIELKKYSTTLLFFRQLMDKYNYPLIDPENPTPPTEMEALVEWFCSEDTPMAREHPEVALARDLVLVVKFLATMETKEIELMRRRVAHQHWQMWQLSFDDASSSHRRNFFGMRGLDRILNASLAWEVTNFRGSDQDIADVEVVGFMDRKIFFGEGPVIASPAELSTLLAGAAKGAASAPSLPSPITEDDIMHLSELPTFHGTLSAEESEYLMCYLTVPYARIPLVTAFFASRDRVTYLFNPMLQQLFRAVLFESGDWVSDAQQADVTHVPLRKSTLLLHEEAIQRVVDARVQHQKCEDHLGTMNGLLLNELVHAPDAIVAPLLKMLDAIKELGEASVHSADAKFILFMIKLAVDMLRYVTFAIDYSLATDATGKKKATPLESYRKSLLAYAFGFGYATLHKWREEAEAANNLQTACVIHSYVVLLHISLRASEYTYERVASMIGSIAYVRNWHCFGMKLSVDAGDDKSGLSAEERLLRWLQAQGIKTENVSKSSLDKYLKGRPLYLKIGMQTIQAPSIVALRDGDGNELKLPPGEVLEEEIFETIQIHRRGVVRWLNSLVSRARHEVLGSIVRIALRSSEPDESHEWTEEADVASTGRYICKKTELKLDAQTGEILWRNDELKPVPDSMTQYGDFKAIFGNKSLHCGLVARQEHRLWVNIIGTDFELVEWDDPTAPVDQGVGAPAVFERGSETPDGDQAAPDELKMYWECPACTCANFNGDNPNAVCDVCATPRFVRAPAPTETSSKDASDVDGYAYLGKTYSRAFDPYSEDEHPHADEQWVVDLVGGVLRLQYPPDPEDKKLPFTFFLPAEPLAAAATRVQLIGHDQGPKEKKEKEKMATFKEIVAYRNHQVVHIYSLVTHGRRMYRKLIFTSNSRLSLHGFALTISPDDGPKDPLLLRAAGDPRERQSNGGTLVVLRRNVALNGTEQFVPPRLLQGVVPSCLLEAFRFWLGNDSKLRGEPVDVKSQWFRYRVELEIVDDAAATITRKSIKTSFSRISSRRDGSGFTSGNKLMPPPAPAAVTGAASATSSRGAAKAPSRDVVVVNDEDVVQLMAMGFSYAACGLALRENHNNVAMAAQWLLDESNQLKIVQAEADAESGDVPMSEEDRHEQNLGLLMSLATSPSRVAAEYALEILDKDLELAKAWLADPTNQDEIQRVEAATSERSSGAEEGVPAPMDVDNDESKSEDVDDVMEVVEETFGETLYLLNVLEATATTTTTGGGGDLLDLSALLSRVEDHSHILIWSTTSGESSGATTGLASIAFIELPRLKLKLKPRREAGASVIRLDVLDQTGWRVSDLTFGARGGESKYLQSIIDLTPDCLVLESDTHDLKLICPNHDVYRPRVQDEPFSTLLVTDRVSMGWQQAMETRFYAYPIHSSHTFVLPPSLSSTLYLILTSLLARKYTAAMELIIGCNVDVKFTDEEKWIFDQLAKTLDDRHPNACACRIRLSLGVAYSDNKVPWSLKPELHDYLSTAAHVDAVCRLTLEEEKEALANCHQRSPLLSLRKAYCDHASETHPSAFEFKLSRSRVGGQPWMKLRLFGKAYMATHGKKLSTVRYNRPKHAAGIDNTFLIDDEEAAKLVWNCAVIGDEDCTRSFGDLFARFLHLKLSRWGRETVEEGEEESVPSYAMAQLALLAAHPHDRWSSSPCDHESAQMLSRGANLYSKVTYGTMLKLFFDSSVEEFESKLQAPAHQDGVVRPIKGQFGRVHDSADRVFRVELAPARAANEFGASNTLCEQRSFAAATHAAINPEFPLDSLGVKQFVTFCDPDAKATPALPFDLSQHPAAQTAAAKDLLKRLDDDIRVNAKAVNESKDAFVSGVTPVEASTLASDGAATKRLDELIRACEALRESDRRTVTSEIVALEHLVNETATSANEHEQVAIDRFVMQRRAGVFPRVTFDFLTSLLASNAFERDLRTRNPFVKRLPADLTERILAVLFLCSRIVHVNRTIQSARALLAQLTAAAAASSDAPEDASNRLKQTLQASKDLADMLLSKRHYLTQQGGDASRWTFDPRFLVFEYVFDLLLRGRQVQMIDSFLASLARGDSRVQQMIMGAGKTTVVGPLLTYILADKQHLVTHVMPTALLEQSRQVLRSRFSNLVLRKRIFTFEFDRSVPDDPANAIKLFEKLNRARAHGDVVCASPESIKSLMLKLVELLHSLEESTDVIELPVRASSQNIRRIRRVLEDRSEMADELYKVIRLWQQGILIMDEVDVLLHPLRSELNFPIGNKFPIDLAANRWELPIHLIDAVLAAPSTAAATDDDNNDDNDNDDAKQPSALVAQLHDVLAEGYRTHSLQKFPHLVLLDMEFYEARMLPLLTQIALAWLLKHFRLGKMDVDIETLTRYLTCPRADLQASADLRGAVEGGLSDLSIKLLNLGRDWLRTILPHVLSKINRVSYGLLRGEHASSAAGAASGAGNAASRLLLAVPFIGKDVPSRSSEFAHPDVLIGLTILAYRYEGIRVSDLVRIVSQLKQDFSRQLGPRDQRPASALFRAWVTSGLAAAVADGRTDARTGAGVLPLPLFQLRDPAQVARLHFLVARCASAVYYYVRQHVFPSCMNFQKLKISACGHELGSNALFAKRIGFSGTPSNLLPMDLGECFYEPRSDGSIFQALTNPRIVSIERKVNWTAQSLLLDIARANPPFHALIDTGALITGFANQEVAAFLLAHLPPAMEGVVYLDSDDRQMILLRDHNAPLPLVQCGLHASKRFTFYDQVHTTGMDIKQCVNACAVVTLGKDMTFRDYAQGAFRMRGIETGQAIHLFLIPEVENRIRHEIALAQSAPLAAQAAGDLQAYLQLVPAWLLVNSMRMESMQLVQLSLQELHNTWRKRALNALMDEIDQSTTVTTAIAARAPSLAARMRRFIGPDDDDVKRWLRACVDKFRVEISYAIEAAVPLKQDLADVIDALVRANASFLTTVPERARVDEVKQRLAHSSSHHHVVEDGSEQGDLRLTAEVVHENEAEAEEEAEEEAEQEEQKMSAYTRDDEHPIPWSTSVLAQPPPVTVVGAASADEDGAFYPFAHFQAHAACPAIAFPAPLLVSGNFFRRRWIGLGERRVKNVGLVLEWTPLGQQEALRTVVHHLFRTVVAESPGIAPNEAAVKALALASAVPTAAASDVSVALQRDVAQAVDALPVFLVALSLAEGETIRRMIHQQHPVFQTSQVQLRTCEGELVESSSFAAAWGVVPPPPTAHSPPQASPRALQVATAVQCLRFFNNEMYFAPAELELLLAGLAGVPLALRHEFFECCLRLRRRERHLWGDTPLAKAFTKEDEWHLLSARARLQQFQQSLQRTKRTLLVPSALRRFDENDDGRLRAEEILKCLESFQLGFSGAELNEIISLIADVGALEAAGGVPMATICAAFGISASQMAEALARDALQQQLAQATDGHDDNTLLLATWSCPVCTFANDGGAESCGACSEPNPVLAQSEKAGGAGPPQGWRCGNCTFINQPSDAACAVCELGMDGQRAVPRGKWICAGEQGGCTFFNPTASFYCEVCNRARPDLAATRF
ncbi:hypothetical protein PybrP1_007186 [[Pythium] brassicae (nom. inval.)]|nr:hypothetical protein PybrP1_007186 [[Pythium] brassicae (nom. inval.)]